MCRVCGRPVHARGLCPAHYQRDRAGRPLSQPVRRYARGATAERVLAHSRWEGECLVWMGAKNEKGYGRVNAGGGATTSPHRAVYEAARGSIEFEIDHLCGNRACVNIDHLEDVPHEVNLARARA